jgi:hypothetical protein
MVDILSKNVIYLSFWLLCVLPNGNLQKSFPQRNILKVVFINLVNTIIVGYRVINSHMYNEFYLCYTNLILDIL